MSSTAPSARSEAPQLRMYPETSPCTIYECVDVRSSFESICERVKSRYGEYPDFITTNTDPLARLWPQKTINMVHLKNHASTGQIETEGYLTNVVMFSHSGLTTWLAWNNDNTSPSGLDLDYQLVKLCSIDHREISMPEEEAQRHVMSVLHSFYNFVDFEGRSEPSAELQPEAAIHHSLDPPSEAATLESIYDATTIQSKADAAAFHFYSTNGFNFGYDNKDHTHDNDDGDDGEDMFPGTTRMAPSGLSTLQTMIERQVAKSSEARATDLQGYLAGGGKRKRGASASSPSHKRNRLSRDDSEPESGSLPSGSEANEGQDDVTNHRGRAAPLKSAPKTVAAATQHVAHTSSSKSAMPTSMPDGWEQMVAPHLLLHDPKAPIVHHLSYTSLTALDQIIAKHTGHESPITYNVHKKDVFSLFEETQQDSEDKTLREWVRHIAAVTMKKKLGKERVGRMLNLWKAVGWLDAYQGIFDLEGVAWACARF